MLITLWCNKSTTYKNNMREEKAKKKSLTQQDNQILISFVNFIIKGQKEIEVKEYLEKQPTKVISNIWKETLLSSRAMELPMKLIEDLETPPQVVNSIEEGERIIMENVNKGNLTGDPFFFRSFII
jgi:hypothetical protein